MLIHFKNANKDLLKDPVAICRSLGPEAKAVLLERFLMGGGGFMCVRVRVRSVFVFVFSLLSHCLIGDKNMS